jgi:hypothetical protein
MDWVTHDNAFVSPVRVAELVPTSLCEGLSFSQLVLFPVSGISLPSPVRLNASKSHHHSLLLGTTSILTHLQRVECNQLYTSRVGNFGT